MSAPRSLQKSRRGKNHAVAPGRRLRHEPLEARMLLSISYPDSSLLADTPPEITIDDVTVTEGDQTPRFIDDFIPAGSGGLNNARSAVFGPDDLLYVTSWGTDEVLRYDAATGAFVDVFIAAGSGGLDRPHDIGFGADGNVYVTSALTDEVLRYDSATGAFMDAFVSSGSGGLSAPNDLEFGPDGNLYVCSRVSNEVLRYDGSSGAFIDAFATAGSGGLSSPQGLAFGPDGNLYVSSHATDKVLRYDWPSGMILGYFVTAGAGGLDGPTGLVFTPEGDLLVGSLWTDEVLRYRGSSGSFLDVYLPQGAGGLDKPRGMSLGPDGNLYVAGDWSQNVVRAGAGSQAVFTVSLSQPSAVPLTVEFSTADGTALAGSDYTATTGTVVFDPGVTARSIVVATLDDDALESDQEFFLDLANPSGATIADGRGVGTIEDDDQPPTVSIDDVTVVEGDDTPQFIDALFPAASGGLDRPRGLVFGPDGFIYVSSMATDEVLRYNAATGRFVDVFVSARSGGLDRPVGLRFGPDGKLYVASVLTDEVLRYDGATGAFFDVFVAGGSGGLDEPSYLEFGPDDNLYVCSRLTDEVLRYDGTNGAFVDAFVASGSGGLDYPEGLAFGPGGALYVSSSFTRQVLRYDGTSGGFLDVFVAAGAGGLDRPAPLLFGPDGNLYVISMITDEVLRYDGATGAFIDAYATAGSGGLDAPKNLAFGPNGNLHVVSDDSRNVLRYGPGSQAVFTLSLSWPRPNPVSVDFSTADGTAIAGSDYDAAGGTVVFDPGVTTRSIIVPTIDDGTWEFDEDFFVNLSNPSGAGIADGQGSGRIVDDDGGGMDFGDVPDPTYPTLLANSGARHTIGGPFMGAMIDAEPDGQPHPAAVGDDANGVPDDEDGVTFVTPLTRGETARVDVDMTFSPAAGLLSAWVDFNADGDWADPGEQVFADTPLVAGSVNQLTFTVPPAAARGFTYARFRVNTAGGLSYDGPAVDGEVEDYRVEIPDPVHVYATTGNDTVTSHTSGTSHTVDVNGAIYAIDDCSELYVHGLGGDDRIRAYLTAADETAYLDVGTLYVDALAGHELRADGFEEIRVYAGGGADEAYLTGSDADDRFYSYEAFSYIKDPTLSFFNYAYGFDYVEADLSITGSAGSDRAYLYDSDAAADDTLTAGPTGAQMDRGADSTVDVAVTGFDVIRADANRGGGPNDRAYLTGSAGDDTFYCYETYGTLSGMGYYLLAGQFDYVEANVTAGGAISRDRAWLFDSPGDDTFRADPTAARIDRGTTGTFDAAAIGFDVTRGYASGGPDHDKAYLTGSTGDDRLFSYETYSYLKDAAGTAFYNFVRDFDYVEAEASGEATADRAYLYDSPGSDVFRGDEASSRMDRGTTGADDVKALGFEVVKASASGGGDEAYLTGSAGDDRFYGYETYGYLKGLGFSTYALHFGHVQADLTGSGGTDRADLYDAAGVDSFFALGDTGQITYAAGSSVQATGVDVGVAHLGGEDSATIVPPSVWTAVYSSPPLHPPGAQPAASAADLAFAQSIATRGRATAKPGDEGEAEEVDPESLDYFFKLFGSE